jgi:hypothetical protein
MAIPRLPTRAIACSAVDSVTRSDGGAPREQMNTRECGLILSSATMIRWALPRDAHQSRLPSSAQAVQMGAVEGPGGGGSRHLLPSGTNERRRLNCIKRFTGEAIRETSGSAADLGTVARDRLCEGRISSANCIEILEAPPGFEPGMEVLQDCSAPRLWLEFANSLSDSTARHRSDPLDTAPDG